MKITIINSGENFLPADLFKRIFGDVVQALEGVVANSKDKFIVNPTIWYNISPTKKGYSEAKPKVINSADYISDKFQSNLHRLGWVSGSHEQTIQNQTIDGYIELVSTNEMFNLAEEKFLNFFTNLPDVERKKFSNLRAAFNYYYSRFCNSGWHLSKEVEHLQHYFTIAERRKVKIGLEFETGNIASSFRALNKLDNLFHQGEIDFGIFVTSLDRASTAAQIWPVSNRNGSFEELQNRNYKAGLTIPLLEIAFQPDELNSKAKYLGSAGELFEPAEENEVQEINGIKYQKFSYNNSPYWKRK
jgi:hypothetical protein